MRTSAAQESESRSILRGLGFGLASVAVLGLASALVLGWRQDKAGDPLRLVVLAIAAIGVPAVPVGL